MDWKEYITTQEGTLGGKPIIKGTRLSVEFLVGRMADGWSDTEILESYPTLTPHSLQAIHAYVYDLLQGGLLHLPSGKKAA